MGRLAELANTNALKGKVAITDENGLTTTYDDEAAAEAAAKGKDIEFRRGGFFVKASVQPVVEAAPEPAMPELPPVVEERPARPSSSRRRKPKPEADG